METPPPATVDATGSLCRFQRSNAPNESDDDFVSVEFRGRKLSVFRRLVKGKRTGGYYVKCEVHGRQIFRGTGEVKKTKAVEVAKLIVGAALDEKWDALRETKLRKEAQVATIGEVLAAYKKHIGTFNLTIKERTKDGYVGALKSVIRRVHEGDPEKLSSSVLTEQLVEQFFASYVKEAGEGFLERDSRIRGANSTLRNARSLFGEDAMRCYRGVKLPDLTGFLKARTAESPAVEHEEISQETLWEIAQAGQCLADGYAPLYIVHLCFRHLGMRNDEIENARMEWIERRPEGLSGEESLAKGWSVYLRNGERREIGAWMVVKRRSYYVPKRSSGRIPIAPDVLAEIDKHTKDLKANDHLVQTRTLTERADLVDRDHADFIRPWLKGHAKVSYELRRWGATLVERRQGKECRDLFLRHADDSVGGKHYSTGQSTVAPITLGDCGLY